MPIVVVEGWWSAARGAEERDHLHWRRAPATNTCNGPLE
jgi:hypothetical protein